MRAQRCILGVVSCVSLLALTGALASAQPSSAHSARVTPSYYLALGDSVTVWDGTKSYPYLLLRHYRHKVPRLSLSDIGIAGETTTSMLDRGQYQRALAFVRAHKHHVALITVDIGGNDVVGCIGPAGDNPTCSGAARATIKRNLTMMLAGLRAAAPDVPLVGMSYYDPFLGDWLGGGPLRAFALGTLPGLHALNSELTSLYGGARKTADVQGKFQATNFKKFVGSRWGRVPIAVQRACAWLNIICAPGEPEGLGQDPNSAGAVAIAAAFEQTIARLKTPLGR